MKLSPACGCIGSVLNGKTGVSSPLWRMQLTDNHFGVVYAFCSVVSVMWGDGPGFCNVLEGERCRLSTTNTLLAIEVSIKLDL
jgi:hypothetical protein